MVEEEQIGLRGRIGRVLLFLIILLLLAIFFAAQLGLRASRPSVVDARIFPQTTADYAPWDLISIRRVDPLVGTLIAQDFLATGSPGPQPEVAFAPTATGTPTRELPTLLPSLTPSTSPTPSPTMTSSATATIVPTVTPVDTQVPPPTATDTATPSATPTASTTPTNTPTSTRTWTPTRTPTATATTEVIIPPPNASFTYAQITGNPPYQVNFTSTSTGSITNYFWNFGDGNTSIQANPSHAFTTLGPHTVSLTVYGPGGATTQTQTIPLFQAPPPTFIPTATPIPPTVPPPTFTPLPTFTPVTPTSTATPTDTPVPAADLSITKTVDNAAPDEGETVVFTLTVTNNGPFDDTGVSVTDTVPAGLTYISDDSGGAYDTGTGLWNVGNLAASGSSTLNITATVNNGTFGTTITNTATVSGTLVDSNAANNTGSASITIGLQSELTLTKTVDNPLPQPGDTVVFTLIVANAGPSNASGVQVTDVLPAGLDFVSASPGGQYNSGSGVWTLPALPSSNSHSLDVTARVSSSVTGGTIVNTATITASNSNDTNPADDTASASVYIASADLQLSLSVSNANPLPGETITFTVRVENFGPDDATGVMVGVQSIPLIAANDVVTFTFDTTIDMNAPPGAPPNPFPFSAEITASDQVDPDSTPANNDPTEDDYDSVAITIQPAADLSVEITADDTSPTNGSPVILTITVDNLGPVDATNVMVDVPLPAGLTYFSDDRSGEYDAVTGVWTIGALAVSDPAVTLNIDVDVTAVSGTPIDVTAVVSGSPTDQNPPNDTDTVTLTVP